MAKHGATYFDNPIFERSNIFKFYQDLTLEKVQTKINKKFLSVYQSFYKFVFIAV